MQAGSQAAGAGQDCCLAVQSEETEGMLQWCTQRAQVYCSTAGHWGRKNRWQQQHARLAMLCLQRQADRSCGVCLEGEA